MSTIAIDSTHPSSTINISVLLNLIDKLLEADRRNSPLPTLAVDEYILLNEIRFAVTTGIPSTNTVTTVTMTY